MKFKFNTKYNTIAFYAVTVFAICMLLVLLCFKLETFIGIMRKIFTALAPVIWGIIIAYLLWPLVRKVETFLQKRVFKKKPESKLNRSLSILVASLITFAAIIALIAAAAPEIVESISGLFNNMPEYLNSLYDYILNFINKNPEISEPMQEWFENQFENIENMLLDWVTNLRPMFEKYLIMLKDGLFSFLIGVKDFFLGYIVSIYLLFSKEHFIGQIKKILYAVIPDKVYNTLMIKGAHANRIFSDFLIGKAIDSLIIGMLCFTILVIFGIPNAMLISFIVGITNMIPFFGPFIGAVPSSLLVLLTAPKKTIVFVVIVLVLQQFDGNILGPKILGNKLNLPTFWIMFSIFFFGNLFGFAGMLAGVPIFAVIYTLTKEFVEERIRVKKLKLKEEGISPADSDLNIADEEVFADDGKIFEEDEVYKEDDTD